ncbi:UNVERIFIED_CONTAM: hypothetical protein Sindi_1660900 [Sesamum indicum]
MDVGSDEGNSMLRRRGGNRHRPIGRRVWTTMEEECLIAALRNLVVTGWKCENRFRNGYLGQLEAYILKHFLHSNIKAEPHITSKLHVWKKNYSTLTTMLTRSGFGWDDSRNMVMVEDDSVWDDYVKMDPFAKGMRHKTWPFFPSWREIFGRDRAIGEQSADPFKEANDDRDEEIGGTHDCNVRDGECNVRDDGCIPEPAEDCVEGEPVSSFNANVDPTQNSSDAKRTGGSSSKKRKSTDLNDGIPNADPFKEANDDRDEEIGGTHDCNVRDGECNVRDDGCIPEPAEDCVEGEPVSSFNANVDPTQNSSDAKRTGGSSSKKRKSTDLNDGIPKLLEMVTNFCDSAARLAKLTKVLENEFGDPKHRSVILQKVRELECIDVNQQLMVANRLVKDPKEMELFLGLIRDYRVKFVCLILASDI